MTTNPTREYTGMNSFRRILLGLRQAGAKVAVDPLAVARWRRVLEQRERDREQREWEALQRRMEGRE